MLAFLVVLGPANLASAVAAAQTYRIAAEQTTARFAVTQLGVLRQQGHFRRASGTILLDPARVSGGSVEVAIDLASVDTGWNLRDEFLRSETMFDVAHYPVMHFHSTRLEYRDGQIVAAEGNVTLHGVTRPLRLEVQRLACGRNYAVGHDGCGATVSGYLLRREFGMEYGYPFVGDSIELEFAITALRVRDDGEKEIP